MDRPTTSSSNGTTASGRQAVPSNPFPTSFPTPSSMHSATFNPAQQTGSNPSFGSTPPPPIPAMNPAHAGSVSSLRGRASPADPAMNITAAPISTAKRAPPIDPGPNRAPGPAAVPIRTAQPVPAPAPAAPRPTSVVASSQPVVPSTSSFRPFFRRNRRSTSPPPPVPGASGGATSSSGKKRSKKTPLSTSLTPMTPWERLSLQAARAREQIRQEEEALARETGVRRPSSAGYSISPTTPWPPHEDSPEPEAGHGFEGVDDEDDGFYDAIVGDEGTSQAHRNSPSFEVSRGSIPRPMSIVSPSIAAESPIVPPFFNPPAKRPDQGTSGDKSKVRWRG